MKKSFRQKHILVFLSAPGLGKTHFFSSMIDWIGENFESCRYHLEAKLLEELKKGFNEGFEWREGLRMKTDDELIIYDDVGRWWLDSQRTDEKKDWSKSVFLEFLDERYNQMLPTIISSNLSEEDFKQVYGERVHSRLFATENTIIQFFEDGYDKRQQGM